MKPQDFESLDSEIQAPVLPPDDIAQLAMLLSMVQCLRSGACGGAGVFVGYRISIRFSQGVQPCSGLTPLPACSPKP